jgi:phosphoheptose isomerase
MPETDQIRNRLFSHIDDIASSLENLSGPIKKASDLLLKTLLNDGKVIIGAESKQMILASYFTSVMLSRYHHERPPLPALNLSSDTTTISTLTQDNNSQSVIFSFQIQALAHQNDLLFLFSMNGKETSIIQAIKAAHEREIPCIILSSSKDDNLQSLINEQDVLITINQVKPSAVLEGQLLTINVLGEIIDQELFGV